MYAYEAGAPKNCYTSASVPSAAKESLQQTKQFMKNQQEQ